MEPPGLNKEQWLEKLTLVDQSLQRQAGSAQLVLVGSAAGILTGQPGRTSIELDVWKPGSRYQYQTLKTAVEEAGLLFDPKMAEPDRPYFQMVEPGLTQLGKGVSGAIPRASFGTAAGGQPCRRKTGPGGGQRSGGCRVSALRLPPIPARDRRGHQIDASRGSGKVGRKSRVP